MTRPGYAIIWNLINSVSCQASPLGKRLDFPSVYYTIHTHKTGMAPSGTKYIACSNIHQVQKKTHNYILYLGGGREPFSFPPLPLNTLLPSPALPAAITHPSRSASSSEAVPRLAPVKSASFRSALKKRAPRKSDPSKLTSFAIAPLKS